jgi:hypothetical protein
MDNIDYPLKLTGCEFAHDLMKGAGFANQQHRRRNRFGYSLFGRPFCPRTIERDAISIAHNRTYPGWPVQRATKSPARGETRSRLVSSRYRAAKARRGPAGSPPGRDHPSPRKGLCRRARIWQRFFPSEPEPAGRDHSASSNDRGSAADAMVAWSRSLSWRPLGRNRTEIEPLKLLPFCRAIHTCESLGSHNENPRLRAGEHP